MTDQHIKFIIYYNSLMTIIVTIIVQYSTLVQ